MSRTLPWWNSGTEVIGVSNFNAMKWNVEKFSIFSQLWVKAFAFQGSQL
jgi:hypothetical protein